MYVTDVDGSARRKIHALYRGKGEAGEIIGERFWDSWGRLKSADKNYGSVERPDPVWVFLRRGLV